MGINTIMDCFLLRFISLDYHYIIYESFRLQMKYHSQGKYKGKVVPIHAMKEHGRVDA
jgi:hypothetical protein